MQIVKSSTASRLKLFILGFILLFGSIWISLTNAQEPEQTFSIQLSDLKTKVERLEAAVKEISDGKPEGTGAASPDVGMVIKSQAGKGMEGDKGMEMKGMAMGNEGGMTEKKGMDAMGGNKAAMYGSALVPIDSQMIQMQMIKMKMMEMQLKMMEMQMKMKMMEVN